MLVDGDGFLAVVDTGFNRTLMMQSTDAEAMGFVITENTVVAESGTTVHALLHRATGTIQWLDRSISVDILISNEPAATHRPDTARALLGTELLEGCLLLVDFASRLVEIETQE